MDYSCQTFLEKNIEVIFTDPSFNYLKANFQSKQHLLLCLKQFKPHGGCKEPAIELQVTSENDPLVLLVCKLTQQDYYKLQEKQNFHVDFNAFPNQFCSFVEKSLQSSNNKSSRFIIGLKAEASGIDPQRILHGECGASLEIVEVNAFRPVPYVSLELISASSQEKAAYLSKSVIELKKLVQDKVCDYDQLNRNNTNKIQELNLSLVQKEEEENEMKREFQKKIDKLNSHQLKEKNLNEEELITTKRNFNEEKVYFQQKIEEERHIIKRKELEIEDQKIELKSFYSKNRKLIDKMEDLKKQIEKLKRESESKRKELTRKITEKLDEICEKDEQLKELQEIVNNNTKDKNEMLDRINYLNHFLDVRGAELLDKCEALEATKAKKKEREQMLIRMRTDLVARLETITSLKEELYQFDDCLKENDRLKETLHSQSKDLDSLKKEKEEIETTFNTRLKNIEEELEGGKKNLENLQKELNSKNIIIAALTKKTLHENLHPVVEEHLPTNNAYVRRPLVTTGTELNPVMATSTPMAALPGHRKSQGAKNIAIGDVSHITEEESVKGPLDPSAKNKENQRGLPNCLLENTTKPKVLKKQKGLLRANAPRGREEFLNKNTKYFRK